MASQPQKSRPEVEILQRVRRIETRLTAGLLELGLRTQRDKPIFNNGTVIVPSTHCSLQEIIDSLPASWHGPFDVLVGTDRVATIDRQGC